jgi:hypothetical protein
MLDQRLYYNVKSTDRGGAAGNAAAANSLGTTAPCADGDGERAQVERANASAQAPPAGAPPGPGPGGLEQASAWLSEEATGPVPLPGSLGPSGGARSPGGVQAVMTAALEDYMLSEAQEAMAGSPTSESTMEDDDDDKDGWRKASMLVGRVLVAASSTPVKVMWDDRATAGLPDGDPGAKAEAIGGPAAPSASGPDQRVNIDPLGVSGVHDARVGFASGLSLLHHIIFRDGLGLLSDISRAATDEQLADVLRDQVRWARPLPI